MFAYEEPGVCVLFGGVADVHMIFTINSDDVILAVLAYFSKGLHSGFGRMFV